MEMLLIDGRCFQVILVLYIYVLFSRIFIVDWVIPEDIKFGFYYKVFRCGLFDCPLLLPCLETQDLGVGKVI